MKFTTNGMQISQASQTDERAEEGRDGWDGGMYGQTSGWPWVVCLALSNLQVNALVAPRQKEPQGQREAKKKKKNITNHLALCAYLWPHGPLPGDHCKGVCVCGIVGAYRSAPNRTFEPNFMSYQRQIATSLRSGHNTWLYGQPWPRQRLDLTPVTIGYKVSHIFTHM